MPYNNLEKNKQVVLCKRCGRRLKSPEAIERGYGKICFQKAQQSNGVKALFITEVILDDKGEK